jgi:hypothetical protein
MRRSFLTSTFISHDRITRLNVIAFGVFGGNMYNKFCLTNSVLVHIGSILSVLHDIEIEFHRFPQAWFSLLICSYLNGIAFIMICNIYLNSSVWCMFKKNTRKDSFIVCAVL